jgi:hypothetical protein
VIGLSSLYLLLWWNRYLSPICGGELFVLNEYDHGRMPYRDYYHFTQPGGILLAVGIGKLFGPRLIAFWAFGALLRVIGLWCLYLWLLRISRPSFAALAVVVTGIVAAGSVTDNPAYYNHQVMNCALLGGFFASRAVEAQTRSSFLWAALSGLFLSWTFLSKQTTGVIVPFVVLLGLFLATWRLNGLRAALTRSGVVILALAVPISLTWGWLEWHGIFGTYLDQVFLSATKSKGGNLATTLFRPFTMTVIDGDCFYPAALAVYAMLIVGVVWATADRMKTGRAKWWHGAIIVGGILVLAFLRLRPWDNPDVTTETPQLATAYVSMFGNLLLLLFALPALWQQPADATALQRGFMAAVCFACAYSLAMSGWGSEVMAFPGLAVVLVMALEKSTGVRAMTRPAIILVCLVLVALAGWRKFTRPFDWGYSCEPPLAQSTQTPGTPELYGFVLSPQTARLFDEVTELIRRHSREEETILTYPHIPVFYGLAQRQPATRAVNHWIDVCPDEVAVADAQRIREHPPAMIVMLDMPEKGYRSQEDIYRNGQPSGQRELAAAIESLTRDYKLVGVFESGYPPWPIKVWARSR